MTYLKDCPDSLSLPPAYTCLSNLAITLHSEFFIVCYPAPPSSCSSSSECSALSSAIYQEARSYPWTCFGCHLGNRWSLRLLTPSKYFFIHWHPRVWPYRIWGPARLSRLSSTPSREAPDSHDPACAYHAYSTTWFLFLHVLVDHSSPIDSPLYHRLLRWTLGTAIDLIFLESYLLASLFI